MVGLWLTMPHHGSGCLHCSILTITKALGQREAVRPQEMPYVPSRVIGNISTLGIKHCDLAELGTLFTAATRRLFQWLFSRCKQSDHMRLRRRKKFRS